jgi:hypothetical protein
LPNHPTTPLASGQVTKVDTLTVELVKPSDHPAIILLRWPDGPSVIEPTANAVAAVAASVVRILAEAQTKLAKIRAR